MSVVPAAPTRPMNEVCIGRSVPPTGVTSRLTRQHLQTNAFLIPYTFLPPAPLSVTTFPVTTAIMARKKQSTTPATPEKKLPSFLHDSYKQYKDDTYDLIGWLINKAKKTSYPTTNVDTCAGLLDLARHVSKKAGRLPTLIAGVAKRAIALRKSVSQTFIKHGAAKGCKDKTHAYFIQGNQSLECTDVLDNADQRYSARGDTSNVRHEHC